MKLVTTKIVRDRVLAIWLVGLCLLLSGPTSLWAEDGSQSLLPGQTEANVVVGTFDGLDMKGRRIWINDTVYILERTVKVKGTSTKLGLLSDLKQGEELKATLEPNEKSPSIPYVVMIERR